MPGHRPHLLDRAAFLRPSGAGVAGVAAGGVTAAVPAAAAPPVAPAGEVRFLHFAATAKLVALELHDRIAAARLVPARVRLRLAALRTPAGALAEIAALEELTIGVGLRPLPPQN